MVYPDKGYDNQQEQEYKLKKTTSFATVILAIHL